MNCLRTLFIICCERMSNVIFLTSNVIFLKEILLIRGELAGSRLRGDWIRFDP